MLSFEEQVKLGISLIKWNVDIKDLKTIDLNCKGISAAYIYEPIKGGKSICVTNTGDALVGNSSKSLDQLVEELKKGKKTNFNTESQGVNTKVKCHHCGDIIEFDTAKVPNGTKFDYKCSNCGAFNMIKFEHELKPLDIVQSAIDYFNKEIFTVENTNDPSWEVECQKTGDELIQIFINQGKSYHYIFAVLDALKDMSAIEKLLEDNNIKLPESKTTRDSILSVFKEKLENVRKVLENKPQGMKW